MLFTVLESRTGSYAPSTKAEARAFLIADDWDDWFKYHTLFSLVVIDSAGQRHRLGGVKIGQFNMREDQSRPSIPDEFDELSDEFFSLGQDDSYYEGLNALGPELRDRILFGLRDIAADPDRFALAIREDVTINSLLRSVTRATATGQFRRIAHGGARLSRYEFSYSPPGAPGSTPIAIDFVVEPESHPPTNIHVIIGRNGVGKTFLLNQLMRALLTEDAQKAGLGSIRSGGGESAATNQFAGIVSVSFSAFDDFEPIPTDGAPHELRYEYVGLKRRAAQPGKRRPPKSPAKLSEEFAKSVFICSQGARLERWRRALERLEADPIFRDINVARLAKARSDDDVRSSPKSASKLFSRLSSGHKIVLLTITRLVETVEERTLVLLDEPEAHLHPPLLSAFVRALSDLLINRNGVAIVATHSPVVLQEVPSRCVWKVRRFGSVLTFERPDIQTFGENVGVLTREVFGLEVTHSGYHTMLRDSVAKHKTFDAVVESFGGDLGGEARAIVAALLAARGN